MKRTNTLTITLLALTCVIASSCGTSTRLKYFQNLPETTSSTTVATSEFIEPVIQPDDIIRINVNTIDPNAAQVINAGNGSVNNNGGSDGGNNNRGFIPGYLVDKTGIIEVPVLGKVKVAGLTTYEAKEALRKEASKYFKDPVINVRFSNFRITVIGEVGSPSTYNIPNERVSILDALGYAGDLNVYGKRRNILVIRKQADGKSVAARIDLTKKEALNSPYFYLKQNDVIYVEPAKARILNTDTSLLRYITLATSLVSTYILLIRFTSLGD